MADKINLLNKNILVHLHCTHTPHFCTVESLKTRYIMQPFTENSEVYQSLLQSECWEKRRKKILERDNYSCVRCGSTNNLNVHHRQYHKKAFNHSFVKPWAYKSNNLVTLCRSCHQMGHKLFKIPVFNI